MCRTKKSPAANGANSNAIYSAYRRKSIQRDQYQNSFTIEVTILTDNAKDTPAVMVLDGRPARSLWRFYQGQAGLTRSEKLDRYFIPSLTRHVHYFRVKIGLYFLTKIIFPFRYATYHLITPVSIRILKQGG